jgi:hypothetical protein
METTHESLHLDKVRYNERSWDIPTSFLSVITFFDGAFEYGGGGIFKPLRWMKNLHQSTWDHEMLYADRSSEDE